MTTNPDRGGAKIILDPCAIHLSGSRFKLEDLLIKFSRAFLIRNRNGDERHFVCDHLQPPFSLSGFNLWIIPEVPNPNSQIPGKIQSPNPKKAAMSSALRDDRREDQGQFARFARERITGGEIIFVGPGSTSRRNKRL